jgi:hypothetical protein
MVFISCHLFSVQSNFYHPASHRSNNQIIEYNVLGERCSGTSFVTALLKANFPTIKHSQRFAHKHFFPWFDLTEENELVLSPWRVDEDAFLKDSDINLFVLVVRNHQDWLRSFFLQPFYVPTANKKDGFLHFIKSEWGIDLSILSIDYHKNDRPEGWSFIWPYQLSSQYYDYNVYSDRHFKNIFELRSYKMRNYLQIGFKVKNFILLRYEDVRQDPEGCVQYISTFYNIPRCNPFVPIVKYKGVENIKYEKKTYFSIPVYTQRYIQKHLDCLIEKKLGYTDHSLLIFSEQ